MNSFVLSALFWRKGGYVFAVRLKMLHGAPYIGVFWSSQVLLFSFLHACSFLPSPFPFTAITGLLLLGNLFEFPAT